MECENERSQQGSVPKYECLLFDLDDTLYPYSSGIAAHCSSNIQEYMAEKLGIEQGKVVDMCFELYKYYGTTMAGLRAVGYQFDYDDYHGFVHGRLPYELLKPDPVLRNLLLTVPIRKVIFTNSDKGHVSRCLARLGLEDCFDEIICFETLNPTSEKPEAPTSSGISPSEIFDIMEYSAQSDTDLVPPKTPIVCKPFKEAFQRAFQIAEIDPEKTLFFDDSVRNVVTASRIGLHTVVVGKSERPEGVQYALESIHNMKEAFPELWEAEEKSDNMRYSQDIAIETPVQA